MRRSVLFVVLSISVSGVLSIQGYADTLQEWFDMHGYSIHEVLDELRIEKFPAGSCTVTIVNGVHAYLNLPGWYTSPINRHLIFAGEPHFGDEASFVADEDFGIYINSNGEIFYTERALNRDGVDHARIYENSQGPGYIVAFEDMLGGGDMDYTDRIILVEITPFGPWYVDCSVGVSGNGRSWPTAFKTIQEGLNAAKEGDEIIVAACVYEENIVFRGRDVFLHSIDPEDPAVVERTIIDGGHRGPVVTFAGSESPQCLFEGFTIRNGTAEHGAGIQGGSEGNHTEATIRNCVLVQNAALVSGGGMAFCDGLIENNEFRENTAGDRGGGLYDCQGTIQGNVVSNGWAYYSGGGLCRCDGLIQNNLVQGNSAGRGGGLDECSGTIQWNTIGGNEANLGGGGLAWCEGTIQGNIIRENVAFYGGGLAWGEGTIQSNLILGNQGVDRGGGVEKCNGVIANNTIVGNQAGDRGGGLADCGGSILNCILWRNVAGRDPQLSACAGPAYCCIEGWSGGEANIREDPGFVDREGPDADPDAFEDNDYRLTRGAACVDAGKNESWMWGASDMDGNARVWCGASFTRADMGAYEYGSCPFRILGITRTPGGVKLTWKSNAGSNYVVWSCDDLVNGMWSRETQQGLPSLGQMTTWIDSDTPVRRRFYRIQLTESLSPAMPAEGHLEVAR